MRRIDVIVVLVLLVGIGFTALRERDEPRARRPIPPAPSQEARDLPIDAIPSPSATDPEFVLEAKPKRSSVTGTAFSVAPGIWLTADHVTEACEAVYIEVGAGYLPSTRVVAHGAADVAVIMTPRSGPPLEVSDRLTRNQNGYHIGFPQGEPGDVVSSLIGRARVKIVGTKNRIEPGVVWAEYRRFPQDLATLGGISGGPVVDGDGRAVGVNIGGSERRGTVLTAAPVSMHQALARAQATEAPADIDRRGGPAPHRLTQFGDQLREALTVAKVVCKAGGEARRPLSRR